MRKLFFASFATVVLLAACATDENKTSSETMSDHKKMSDKSERNLAAARAVSNAFQTGNANSIDTVVGDDFLDHTDQGDKIGRDSLKAMITIMHKNGKEMKMEAMRELADDDYVFQWMRYTGTSDGSMGPAGPYDMKIIEVSKYKDGKVIEHWAYVNMVEMMKMMGQMGQGQPQPNLSEMDTSKRKL